MRWANVTLVGLGLLFVLCFCSKGSTGPPPELTAATRTALDAYRAELLASAGSDPIIDPDLPAFANRIRRPARARFSPPEVSTDLRQRRAHGQTVVAGVLERDGSVGKAKLVGSSGYSAFD